MEQRNLTHFSDRLDKESFSKDEVAKMLHNEAEFTAQQTRKEFDGFISREDFDKVSTELGSVREELAPYKQADFDAIASSEFDKLNGETNRFNDFKSIAHLKGTETSEEILAKATEMKSSGNYGFMFKVENSGAATQVANTEHSPKTPARGPITPKMGAYNLFKKRK